VVVAATREEANAAIDAMLGTGRTAKGARVVIEEFLEGEEASFMVVCDGRGVLPLATSQDHKRIGDGDTGPNTGGMGAYSPAPVVTPNVHARVMHEIVLPTIAGMAADGIPFSGFLYVGLMIDAHGEPKTVEFNCRLGDPETQPILMRLKSDLFELLMKATANDLAEPIENVELQWDRRVALGVVMASQGYPAEPRSGDVITGLPAPSEAVKVFHAGTQLRDGQPVTAGGRVLCVTALGDSTKQAHQHAYEAVRGISFAGAQYRRDIGQRAIKR
jgi:phosphoribosylamine--glycine ligase